jgi:hypothetical protein
MVGFLVSGTGVSKADIEKYLAALRQAQMEIDLHPEAYKHYHLRAVPEKYRDQVDVRAFGTGERIVFLPYTREVFASTQQWTRSLLNKPHFTMINIAKPQFSGLWLDRQRDYSVRS